MTKTGFFGGSFNPIHNGHIALARQLLGLCNLDEIWFVVSPLNPLKAQSDLLADTIRFQMVEEALADEPLLYASDFELQLPKPSYTWHTLSQLTAFYPDRSFTLLIGADNWKNFDRWFRADDILSNYPVVVYPRKGSFVSADRLPKGVRLVKAKQYDISSTQIRRRIQNKQSIRGLVPEKVEQIIQKNHLYLAEKTTV